MAHKWMQGPMPTEQEVVAEFQKRDLKVKAALEADRQAKEAEKQKRDLLQTVETMKKKGNFDLDQLEEMGIHLDRAKFQTARLDQASMGS